jgi:hypothetical protein
MPAFSADTYSLQQGNRLYADAHTDDDIVIALKHIFCLHKGQWQLLCVKPESRSLA